MSDEAVTAHSLRTIVAAPIGIIEVAVITVFARVYLPVATSLAHVTLSLAHPDGEHLG